MRIGAVSCGDGELTAPVMRVLLAADEARSSTGIFPSSFAGRLMAGILPVVPVLRRGVGALPDVPDDETLIGVPVVAPDVGVGDVASRLGTRTSQGRSMGAVGSLAMSDGSLMTLRSEFFLADFPASCIWSGDPHSEQNFAPWMLLKPHMAQRIFAPLCLSRLRVE